MVAADAVRGRFRAMAAGVSACRLASSATALELVGKNGRGLPVLAIERRTGAAGIRIVQRVYNDDGTVARWSLHHDRIPPEVKAEGAPRSRGAG